MIGDTPGPLLDIAELAKRFTVGSKQSLLARATSFRKPVAPLPQLHAVDEVSFTIGRGETVGLVGESGCGKSTLVRLINRLLDPTSGSIRLGGAELADFKARDFAANPHRARIQMVFQDAGDSLNPRYTAADAIAEPRSPIDPDPTVCRFYGRCPKGTPRCAEEMPLLRPAGPARQVACHFAT